MVVCFKIVGVVFVEVLFLILVVVVRNVVNLMCGFVWFSMLIVIVSVVVGVFILM